MILAQGNRLPGYMIRAVISGAIFGLLLEIQLQRENANDFLIVVLAVLVVLPLLKASRLEGQTHPHLDESVPDSN